MPGELDPLYVAARRGLLDALEAIRPHLDSIVLVGAQAVYVHAGEADLAVAPYTTDGDLALDPIRLRPEPLLEVSLERAGFRRTNGAVGIWQESVIVEGFTRTVAVDLLVPESMGGSGRRSAEIPPHARLTARKVEGLEGALVDRDLHWIGALQVEDKRALELMIAGPAALVVAKVHKIRDRRGDADRGSDKDALDLYRLLRAVPTGLLAGRFHVLLDDAISRQVTETTLEELPRLFGRATADGTQMAVRAASPLEDADTIAASVAALTQDLIQAVQ